MGPKLLLENYYWYHKDMEEFLDRTLGLNGLLDFMTQALAPPWRRPTAKELAGHRLFQPVSPCVSGPCCNSF